MGEVGKQRLLMLLVRALVLFTAFPFHESAHALTAHWLGDDTAKKEGRISLNPFKHINLFGALFMLFAGIGAAQPVSINSDNFKNKKLGMAISSFAGPLSNLLLAYISILVYRVLFYMSIIKNADYSIIMYVFSYGALLNIGLAVFNLLPIPPLDGSRIITLFLPEDKYFGIMKYEKYIFAVLFVVMISGVLNAPLSFLQGKVLEGMAFLTGWVDHLIPLFAGSAV